MAVRQELIDPESPRALTRRTGRSSLTRREREVLDQIRLGLTNRQIAQRLFVSTNTVNKHVQSVLRKLYVSNRVQAATRAQAAGD